MRVSQLRATNWPAKNNASLKALINEYFQNRERDLLMINASNGVVTNKYKTLGSSGLHVIIIITILMKNEMSKKMVNVVHRCRDLQKLGH